MRSRRSLDRPRAVLAALWTVCVMAGGCMVGPNYARPAVEQPAQFKSQADSEAAPAIAREWWQLYGDPELDRLIATASASNQTLRQAAASTDDAGLVRLTVETDVAQFYYSLRSLDAQLQILTDNVAAYREQVRLLSVQLKTGLISAIVLNQAQAQLQATLAQQRDVERARANLEHALAILCGQPAPSFSIAANPLHESAPPAVPPGLPAQILARRPDVAEAEQTVVALNAQIGVATAEFFPRFMLTSSAGFESANLSTLFSWQSRVASISPSVSIPIFEGGRLRANLEATRARYQQAVAAYVNQVLIAYGDVEDALTDLHALSDEVGTLREAVAASQSYLRLAQVQYRQGLTDYLLVIDAERTLLANQLSLAQAVNLQMGASIRLIKALGGGWNPSEDPRLVDRLAP